MRITIDGHAGAGKTTMTRRLSQALDLQILDEQRDTLGSIWREIKKTDNNLDHRHLFFLWKILTHRSERWHEHSVYVMDEFWLPLWMIGPQDAAYQLLEDIMTFKEGTLPILSFYLDITTAESRKRVRERYMKTHNNSVEGYIEPPRPEDNNRRDRYFWKWLGTKFMPLYTIDAMRDEDTVFAEIEDITRSILQYETHCSL